MRATACRPLPCGVGPTETGPYSLPGWRARFCSGLRISRPSRPSPHPDAAPLHRCTGVSPVSSSTRPAKNADKWHPLGMLGPPRSPIEGRPCDTPLPPPSPPCNPGLGLPPTTARTCCPKSGRAFSPTVAPLLRHFHGTRHLTAQPIWPKSQGRRGKDIPPGSVQYVRNPHNTKGTIITKGPRVIFFSLTEPFNDDYQWPLLTDVSTPGAAPGPRMTSLWTRTGCRAGGCSTGSRCVPGGEGGVSVRRGKGGFDPPPREKANTKEYLVLRQTENYHSMFFTP